MSLESSTWRAGTAAHGHCGNCGAQLNGTYCGVCGQAGHLHRSLLHLAEEFLHGVLHFDTKGFRTLPLLVARPGLLTRRYIAGQRTRYVSPLALFLFCTFLMYFVFSLYSLSFMSLLFTSAALMLLTGWTEVVALCVILIPPIHMFRQLRETYGLGTFSALWRTFALLCVCGTVFLLFVLFVLMMTVH